MENIKMEDLQKAIEEQKPQVVSNARKITIEVTDSNATLTVDETASIFELVAVLQAVLNNILKK